MGIFGKSDAVKLSEESVKKRYEADRANYEYQWGIGKDSYTDENPDGEQLTYKGPDGETRNTGKIWDEYYHSLDTLKLKKQADQESQTYSEETAQQQWDMGKSAQEYNWAQEDAIYKQSEEAYTSTTVFNQNEFNNAIERENMVMDEQFIQFAFENQGMIADLYEQTGSAGFDQVASKLNLLKQEELADSQTQKHLINLKQNTQSGLAQEAGVQIGMLDQKGQSEYKSAGIVTNLASNESDRRFQRATLIMDSATQERVAQEKNELIRRETRQINAKHAHESTERNLKALQAQGQAALSQSGRSQGKAVQMVLAELGRQQAYIADSLIHGSGIAEARMKQNINQVADTESRSKLAMQQIGEKTGQDIENTLMNLEEVERNLKIGNAKGELNLDKIKQQIFNNVENTTLDVKVLENNLKHAQTGTALDLKKIDWNIDNLGSRFTTNQDILKATIDSSVEASAMNIKDITHARDQANMEANIRRMINPALGREELDLENFKPAGVAGSDITLPEPKYQDPKAPKRPPVPIKGAAMSESVGIGDIAGAAVTGASAGLAAVELLGATNPVGWLIGAGTFIAGL